MKTFYNIFLFMACVLYLGCSKEEVKERPVPADGEIRLDALAAGQSSSYREYRTTCDDMDDISFTGNILVVTSMIDEGQLYFTEQYTEDSPDDMEPVRYEVHVYDDYLLVPDRSASRLFFFYGNDTIHLSPVPSKSLKQRSCFLMDGNDRFVGNSIAEVADFNLGIAREQDQTVVSCVPNFELDAYLIYDEYQLQTSHTVSTSEFNGQVDTWVNGWSLIDR